MAGFGNQFSNYKAHERAPYLYSLDNVREFVDGLVATISERPELCLIPERSALQVRTEHGRMRCSVRALVCHAVGQDIPENGYGTPICGNAGCINPKHQAPPGSRPGSRPSPIHMGFEQHEPRHV